MQYFFSILHPWGVWQSLPHWPSCAVTEGINGELDRVFVGYSFVDIDTDMSAMIIADCLNGQRLHPCSFLSELFSFLHEQFFSKINHFDFNRRYRHNCLFYGSQLDTACLSRRDTGLVLGLWHAELGWDRWEWLPLYFWSLDFSLLEFQMCHSKLIDATMLSNVYMLLIIIMLSIHIIFWYSTTRVTKVSYKWDCWCLQCFIFSI